MAVHYDQYGNPIEDKRSGCREGCGWIAGIFVVALVIWGGIRFFGLVSDVGRQERERQQQPDVHESRARAKEALAAFRKIQEAARSYFYRTGQAPQDTGTLDLGTKLAGSYYQLENYEITVVEGTTMYVICKTTAFENYTYKFDLVGNGNGEFGVNRIQSVNVRMEEECMLTPPPRLFSASSTSVRRSPQLQ